MTDSSNSSYDVAIVGAGPVGSLCALAHARKGARVALLEANPKAAGRLAGEWLHPPAVRMLQENGVSLDACPHSSQGNGFVVFPDDRSEPIVLPYSSGAMGMTCEHSELVATLHQAMEDNSQVRFFRGARVQNIENGRITYSINGTQNSLATDRVIGADGRSSIVRKSLGLPSERMTCSRMIGVVAEGIDLPHEGYGHVILGGPGPILIFRLGENTVRIIVDVPLDHWTPRDRVAMLTESYAYLLPESVRQEFIRALEAGEFQAAGNELQLRAYLWNLAPCAYRRCCRTLPPLDRDWANAWFQRCVVSRGTTGLSRIRGKAYRSSPNARTTCSLPLRDIRGLQGRNRCY